MRRAGVDRLAVNAPRIRDEVPLADLFRTTRQAFLDHERSKAELKALMPEDAKEAVGHSIRAKRSKSGAVSFDLIEAEGSRAAL